MLTPRSDIHSTAIHPITKQAINEGMLPAGTKVYTKSSYGEEFDDSTGTVLVTFRVKDAKGFIGLEQAEKSALKAVL